MDVTLTIEEEGSGRVHETTVQVDGDAAVSDALAAADVNPETVLVEQDGSIVPKDAEIGGSENLRVLQVVSGG